LDSGRGWGSYRRTLSGTLAVVLAVVGQWALGQSRLLEAGLLYALAVVPFVAAVRAQPGPVAPDSPEREGQPRRLLLFVGLFVVATAALAGIAGVLAFASPDRLSLGWILYGASLLLLLLGVGLADLGRRVGGRVTGWSRGELGLLLAILALGAVVRFWDLDSLPYGTWYDEAENGLVAQRILSEPSYRPVYEPRVNSAGHYLLLLAASVGLLGSTTAAIRVVSALMGTACVAAGYLVGREMFGRRWGLVLAFLLAVSRWHINFSRIGMYNVATPLLELAALGFLLRGLRRQRWTDLGLAGVTLGLGMVFYTGFLPFPLVLLAFLLHTAVAERQVLRSSWRGLMIVLLALLLTVGPVLRYVVRDPDEFWERAQKTSIFTGKTPQEAVAAVKESLVKHLLMFTYEGDRYGRHNLSHEPMLDPVSGALMVLGLAVCLWRWRRPRSLLLVLWLVVLLLPGVFSLEWEAPHSLRTIGSLPAAYLLAVVPINGLWEEWRRAFGGRRLAWFGAVVVLVLGVVGCSNLHTYFFVQARDFTSWRDFSTAETITARIMAGLGNSVDYYVISLYHDHPVLHFLAPEVTEYQQIETHDGLPLPSSTGKDVVMILDPERNYLYEQAQAYYPKATFEEYGAPFGGPAVVYLVRLTSEDIAALEGLVATYRKGTDWSAEPSLTRQEASLSANWTDGDPLELPFLAEWTGTLTAPEYGIYRLVLRVPSHAELYMDEALLLEGQGELAVEVSLGRGNHGLRVRARGAEGHVELAWQPPGGDEQTVPSSALHVPPVSGHGLLGNYFPNGEWSPPEAFARIDPWLGVYFHIPPLDHPYTVAWEGQILISEPGVYVFALQSIDESMLYVDGELVTSSLQRDEYGAGSVLLEEGLHDIRVLYAARTHHTYINLYWVPPKGQREIVPAEVLFPAQATPQTTVSSE
jgi:4-amino-4-deoxy-L-arabinose transferase-like glycosyltransferase